MLLEPLVPIETNYELHLLVNGCNILLSVAKKKKKHASNASDYIRKGKVGFKTICTQTACISTKNLLYMLSIKYSPAECGMKTHIFIIFQIRVGNYNIIYTITHGKITFYLLSYNYKCINKFQKLQRNIKSIVSTKQKNNFKA